jgi:glutamate 5-kinase
VVNTHQQLVDTKRWVIKIGSALLTRVGEGLDLDRVNWLSGEIAKLRLQGKEVVLVTSGSVAAGMQQLGWDKRPHALHLLQSAASVGQMGLIQAYASACKQHDIHTAQILLTHADLSDRSRYLNARSTLSSLLDLNVLPVVNENDTIATEEIRFGDNDTLAAMTANLVEADVLVILTDQDGLFEADPRQNPAAQLITASAANNTELDAMAGESKGALGRGGMATKLLAARRAARSGATTVILSGKQSDNLQKLSQGKTIGTLLWADSEPMTARQQWLVGHLTPKGTITLDQGAVNVVQQQGKSVLVVGVKSVEGQFSRGELVVCHNLSGEEIARGLVNYNADESRKIMGKSSNEIESVLGYVDEPELIHRDNLVVTV